MGNNLAAGHNRDGAHRGFAEPLVAHVVTNPIAEVERHQAAWSAQHPGVLSVIQ